MAIMSQLFAWVQTGLLVPVRTIEGRFYFHQGDVDAFVQTYLLPNQAAKVLNRSEEDVLQLIAAGVLNFVTAPQEHWIPLTASETCECPAACGTMNRWLLCVFVPIINVLTPTLLAP